MAVFRVERNKGYTVMSNHHLRNKELSLKAKGLLSQMLSLPEDWDYSMRSFTRQGTRRSVPSAARSLRQAPTASNTAPTAGSVSPADKPPSA